MDEQGPIDLDAVLIERVRESVQCVDSPETKRLLKQLPMP